MVKGNSNSRPVLVLGAHGKTGSRIVERLQAAGKAVRLGSRSATPRFDWDDRATWAAALEGVGAVYVAYQPDLCVPGAVETVTGFFAAAAGAGVEKIVLLSGRGEPEALAAEQALQATSLEWTIIRASWFFQNFSESFFLDEIRAGEVTLPATLAAEPFVDADDIADIAVLALTTEDHNRQLYEVTGPEALTFAQTISMIGEAAGRPIQFRTVPMDAYRQGLIAAQLPSELVDLVIYLFSTVLDGRNTPVTVGVQRALGRAPRSFSEYVRRTAKTGVWQGAQQ